MSDTTAGEIYTLSLHDALPICSSAVERVASAAGGSSSPVSRTHRPIRPAHFMSDGQSRSEEHTSELQPQSNLVCRLLLEKKNSSAEEATNTTNPVKNSVTQTTP